MNGRNRRTWIDRFADDLVTNLDAALRAYRPPVVFVEVDESGPRWHLLGRRKQLQLDDVAGAFADSVARRGIPQCSPATAYTGEPTASVVVLRRCGGDEEVSVLDRAVRRSRKYARLTVVVYSSQLVAGMREALDSWRSIGADHARLDSRRWRSIGMATQPILDH
jgi:hypothetical protein